MRKVLLLSERLPFPPTSGTKNLLYNYCKIFHERLGLEVISVSFMEADDEGYQKPDFINKVYELPNPSTKTKLKNLLIETFIRKKFPMQVSLYWDYSIKKRVDEIVESEKPDLVIADLVRTAEYLKEYPGRKILDMQDLFSLRYERQLAMDMKYVNPYGAYLFRLPGLVQKILGWTPLKKAVMKTEINLLKRYEVQAGKSYDGVLFVAKREGEIYNARLGEQKAVIAPLGVEYEYFASSRQVKKKPGSIAFMGVLSVAHNENGIIHFVEEIFPLVLAKNSEAELYVIGGGATDGVKKLASDKVILTGRVDDVRDAVGSCEVFVCPLQFGSGIKTKNLEAMAMGIPVVTTAVGAENIEAENGHDWFVCKDDQEFADCVCRLLHNTKLRKQIGLNGQKFVKDNFSWSNAEDAFTRVVEMKKNNRGGVLHNVVSLSTNTKYAAAGRAVA